MSQESKKIIGYIKNLALTNSSYVAVLSRLNIKPLLCKTILAYIKCLAFSNTISYI